MKDTRFLLSRRQFIRRGTCGLGALVLGPTVVHSLYGANASLRAGEATRGADADLFTMVFLTDTHLDMKCSAADLASNARWIAANKEALNIRYVGHHGDVGDRRGTGVIEEMLRKCRHALQPVLDAGIPLAVAIGNHDYDRTSPPTRPCRIFNRADTFGVEMYAGMPGFGGTFDSESSRPGMNPAGAANHYYTQSLFGRNYLFLVLEHYPREKVMTWADNLVRRRLPDHDVMVSTHAYLRVSGLRCRGVSYPESERLRDAPREELFSREPGPEYSNDGEEMWEKYLKKWKNLRLVTSGHFQSSNVNEPRQNYLQQRGVDGNIAHAHFWNYQNWGFKDGGPVYGARGARHQGAMMKLFRIYPRRNEVFIENVLPPDLNEGESARPDFYHYHLRA